MNLGKVKNILSLVLLVVLVVFLVVFITFLVRDTGKNNNNQNGATPTAETEEPTATPDPENGDNTPVPSSEPSSSSDPEPTPNITPTPSEGPVSGPLSGITVYINPGHQAVQMKDKEPLAPWGPECNSKYNNTVTKAKCTSGTEGQKTHTEEHKINLQIALKLKELCLAQGAEVVMSRETADVTKSNVDRAKEANACGADISLNIHCNGAESKSANGIDIYSRGTGEGTSSYKNKTDRDYSLAESLLNEVCSATGAKKRYVSKTDEYSSINWAENTSLIIECGFLSNEEEEAKLVSDEYQQLLATGMLNFLLKEYGRR